MARGPMRSFASWLIQKWQHHDEEELAKHVQICFNTASGRKVLQWLTDEIYATIPDACDFDSLAFHNGTRSVVHKIYQLLDQAEAPEKYGAPKVEV